MSITTYRILHVSMRVCIFIYIYIQVLNVRSICITCVGCFRTREEKQNENMYYAQTCRLKIIIENILQCINWWHTSIKPCLSTNRTFDKNTIRNCHEQHIRSCYILRMNMCFIIPMEQWIHEYTHRYCVVSTSICSMFDLFTNGTIEEFVYFLFEFHSCHLIVPTWIEWMNNTDKSKRLCKQLVW
jgi:hypothetical protein